MLTLDPSRKLPSALKNGNSQTTVEAWTSANLLNLTMSTCINDDSERDYDDHDDASLPDLQPSVYAISVINHCCHDSLIKSQESDQLLPIEFQPQLKQPQFFHLDQLSSMTKELILMASDTLSTLSCNSQPSNPLITIQFANGSFASSYLSRVSFSTRRSLLKEKSDKFLRRQSIFKPKRQDQRKSAAVMGSRTPVEKLGNCQDQPKKAEGPTDFGFILCHGNLKKAEGPTDFGFTSHHGNLERMMSTSLSKPCSMDVCYSCRMKHFKLVGSYSPVDRGVNGGKLRSGNTRLVFIKRMH
jgi:hypothetical protein